MLEYVVTELNKIEDLISPSHTRSDVLKQLRRLSFSDFGGVLLSIPNPDYPKISSLLPKMASDDVQQSWTGSAGLTLLTQSVDFVRALIYNFTKLTGRSLENSKILDFGCGYGRITRLMYYFSDEDHVFGVDPWDQSIEICHADGLRKNFHVSDYLPSRLPITETQFDLIFAFSVFTHLSKRATETCLHTLTDHIKPDGIIAITIRPVEYWDVDIEARKLDVVEHQKSLHREVGFSFLAHNRSSVDGDVTYGDTSLTMEWLKQSFPSLTLVGMDRSLSDPYQIYIFLQKKN